MEAQEVRVSDGGVVSLPPKQAWDRWRESPAISVNDRRGPRDPDFTGVRGGSAFAGSPGPDRRGTPLFPTFHR